MFDLDSFSKAIMAGELDTKLEQLSQVIALRRQIHGQLKAIDFKIGDRIRFIDTMRPQYLRGVTGTITGRKTKKFVIDLDERHDRFYKGVVCPPTIIEKIEA